MTSARICLLCFLFTCSVAVAGEKPVIPPSMPPGMHGKVIDADRATWRKDPFVGAVKKKTAAVMSLKQATLKNLLTKPVHEPEEEVVLQGIMKVGRGYHALINGRVVKVGDRIGNQTVSQITRYDVSLRNENKDVSLYDIYQGKIDRGTK